MKNSGAAAFAEDYPTQKLIQKWIDGEKDHMVWEAHLIWVLRNSIKSYNFAHDSERYERNVVSKTAAKG